MERHRRGEQACLRCDGLDGDAELREAVLGDARTGREAFGQAREGALEELHGAFAGRGHHRCQRYPDEVDGGRERKCVEVPDGDDALVVPGDDEWIPLVGVQLDGELVTREPQRVSRRPVYLRQATERERVLQVAGEARVPERAAGECGPHPVERDPEAAVRAGVGEGRVEEVEVRRERLEIERTGDVDRVQKGRGVGEGQCAVRGRDGVVVEHGDPLTRGEGEVPQRVVGEVGVRGHAAQWPAKAKHGRATARAVPHRC